MNQSVSDEASFLPDFCRAPAIFRLLLISQIIAVLLVLAYPAKDFLFGPRLLVVSLYLHWISLLCAAALCWLRDRIGAWPVALGASVALLIMLGVTLLVSEAAYQIGRFMQWDRFIEPGTHLRFLARNTLLCSIVATALLRYFYVSHAWRRQVQASAEARFAALQARIRPHFLFNSLNSVAALIPGRPDDAEALIVDLSELFRAILKTHEPWNSLRDEIELAFTYLRIEQLRLGERLRQSWQIPDELGDLKLPLLSLQPLLENGIFHGIELMPDGGTLQVTICRDGKNLRITVTNPVPREGRSEPGSGIAQDNIRQRLRLLYDERASLITQRTEGEYRAELCVPV